MFGTSLTKKNYSKLIYCYSSKYDTIEKSMVLYINRKLWNFDERRKTNIVDDQKLKQIDLSWKKNYGNIPKQLTFLNK